MGKRKVLLVSLLSLALVSTASMTAVRTASANETEKWRYFAKDMTYKWAPNFNNTTFKNGWTGAVNSWNGKGMNIYQHSNSANTLGEFYESTGLYGRMTTRYSSSNIVTSFTGEINAGNSSNVNTNVPLSVAVHEIAHSMGLAHNSQNSIMNNERNRNNLYYPTSYDVQTMKQLYTGTIGWNSLTATTEKVPQEATSQINVSYDFPSASTIQEMASEADVVISGEYTSNEYEKWNMSRNPENPLKESSEKYTEGRLYKFKVESVLKGTLSDKEIKVNHRVAEMIKVELEEGKTQEVKVADPRFIEPTAGQKYLLFLKKDDKLNNYYGAIEPFSVIITNQDNVRVESNLVGKQDYTDKVHVSNGLYLETEEEGTVDTISGSSLSELIEKIDLPIQ